MAGGDQVTRNVPEAARAAFDAQIAAIPGAAIVAANGTAVTIAVAGDTPMATAFGLKAVAALAIPG